MPLASEDIEWAVCPVTRACLTRLTLKAEQHKLICLLLNDIRLLIIYLYVPCSCCTNLESFLRKSPSSIGTTFYWVTMSCHIFQLLTNQKHAYYTWPKTNMEPWKMKLWNRRCFPFSNGVIEFQLPNHHPTCTEEGGRVEAAAWSTWLPWLTCFLISFLPFSHLPTRELTYPTWGIGKSSTQKYL